MKILPSEFSGIAARWGSFMRDGDPGACLYGFGGDGMVQSEAHRRECVVFIERHCRAAAAANEAAGEPREEQSGELDAMIDYLNTAPVRGSAPALDAFTAAYVKAALFSTNDESTPEGGAPLDDNYGVEHVDAATLRRMRADCERFQELYGDLIADDNLARGIGSDEQAGHDFWLTRNGHGAGFWDGDWREEAGETLTAAAKSFGEFDLYVGDDGFVHGAGGVEDPESVRDAEPTGPRGP